MLKVNEVNAPPQVCRPLVEIFCPPEADLWHFMAKLFINRRDTLILVRRRRIRQFRHFWHFRHLLGNPNSYSEANWSF